MNQPRPTGTLALPDLRIIPTCIHFPPLPLSSRSDTVMSVHGYGRNGRDGDRGYQAGQDR